MLAFSLVKATVALLATAVLAAAAVAPVAPVADMLEARADTTATPAKKCYCLPSKASVPKEYANCDWCCSGTCMMKIAIYPPPPDVSSSPIVSLFINANRRPIGLRVKRSLSEQCGPARRALRSLIMSGVAVITVYTLA